GDVGGTASGVASLNGLTGNVDITSSNNSIDVNLAGLDVNISLADDAVTTNKIADNQVTFDKIQLITSNRLMGNLGGGISVGEVSIAGGLSLTGGGFGTLTTSPFSGDVTTPPQSFVTTISNNAVSNSKFR